MKKRVCDLCDENIYLLNDYIRVKTKRVYRVEPFFNMGDDKEKFDLCPSCYERIKAIIKKEEEKDD